jgi:hypothetical protein
VGKGLAYRRDSWALSAEGCEIVEEEFALRCWLESRPRSVEELLARIVDEPAGLFRWLEERAA